MFGVESDAIRGKIEATATHFVIKENTADLLQLHLACVPRVTWIPLRDKTGVTKQTAPELTCLLGPCAHAQPRSRQRSDT